MQARGVQFVPYGLPRLNVAFGRGDGRGFTVGPGFAGPGGQSVRPPFQAVPAGGGGDCGMAMSRCPKAWGNAPAGSRVVLAEGHLPPGVTPATPQDGAELFWPKAICHRSLG